MSCAVAEFGDARVEIGAADTAGGRVALFERKAVGKLVDAAVVELVCIAPRVGCAILHVGERRLLLMHGDSLCTDDIAHQKFRAMVLDPVWQDMFLSKTIDERDAMARLARYRSNDGKTTKSAEIMDVTAAAVNDVMEQHSVTLLIHGHTHRPAVHQLKDSGATRHRVVLGDWDTAESVIALSEEKLTLRFRGQDHTLAL